MRLLNRVNTFKEKSGWLLIFLVGFVLGVLYINLKDQTNLLNSELVSTYTMDRLKGLVINKNRFLIYCLQNRIQIILFLTLLEIGRAHV